MTQEPIERTFEVKAPASLLLANISGAVDIQAGDDGLITVTAVKQGGGDADAGNTRIEMAQDDAGAVTIKTEYGESFWRFFGQKPCDVAYTVRAPRNTAVTLKVISSTASISGLTGPCDISTVSGDLALADLTGPIKVNLVSGRLHAEKLAGAGDISTVSGRADLAGCNFSSLHLSTVSGAVSIETPLGEGPYSLHSVSGDVQLLVQPNASCTVDFNTLSGRCTSNLPTTHSQQTGRTRHLQLQGGGVMVKFDSISANLNIQSAQGAVGKTSEAVAEGLLPLGGATTPVPPNAFVPPVPPTPPVTREVVSDAEIKSAEQARQDILDRVAQGKLSVNDAVNLLRG